MPTSADIHWFKATFGAQIEPKIAGTVFTLDMLAALACQETGEVWPILRVAGLPTARILELCVGDTHDADKGRPAFPRTKAELIAHPNGQAMFDVAHQALVDMAAFVASYRTSAARPNKFCHAFGIFQYDLQFLDHDLNYFLRREYADFGIGLDRCLRELNTALHTTGLEGKALLTDIEMAYVGIAYNSGGFRPSRGLQQGYWDGTKFYGQSFFDFIRLAHTVSNDPNAVPTAPTQGRAMVPPPPPIVDGAQISVADTGALQLRIRSAPEADAETSSSNVVAEIPDGHPVAVVAGGNRMFNAIETSLHGATFTGFVRKRYLSPAAAYADISVAVPASSDPVQGLEAVYAPRREGSITRRTGPASPQSLNEKNQPGRQGTDASTLRQEIAAIVEWLGVDDPNHLRYQPGAGKTYCNVYAHDLCFLSGVYLPRVWWTGSAIEQIGSGRNVVPKLGVTVDDQRANDLFRWLRDFGLRFGWRRSVSTMELQTEVNQGAIGIIVARRKEAASQGISWRSFRRPRKGVRGGMHRVTFYHRSRVRLEREIFSMVVCRRVGGTTVSSPRARFGSMRSEAADRFRSGQIRALMVNVANWRALRALPTAYRGQAAGRAGRRKTRRRAS